MRPGVLKQALVVVGCGVLAVSASACESTEDESAKIGREGSAAVTSASTFKLGAANHSVRVSDATLLSSDGRTAVAVKLTSTSPRPQLDVPVLVDVTGAGHKVVYSNATSGAVALLQRIALLRPHQSAWWVDDQVLGAGAATGVKVSVGTGRHGGGSASTASVSTTGAHVGQQSGLSALSGELVNHSGKAQGKVAVFAVALRGGKIVAAGRAVVASLAAHASATAPFQIFFVGNPAGAKIELTAIPSAA
jgi:hypothetical protein